MPKYPVAIHHSDDYDASLETEAMHCDLDALNNEMIAAGVRVFLGGLHPAGEAKSLRAQSDGNLDHKLGSDPAICEHCALMSRCIL